MNQVLDAQPGSDTGPDCDETPPECVGPMMIPPALTRALSRLARAAAVDDLAPLSVCATELVRRLSPPGAPARALVIRGPLEGLTPLWTQQFDPTMSFRGALRWPAERRVSREPGRMPAASTPPVDVAILVSVDGDRLYVERMTRSSDAPAAHDWARSFLRLLSCAGSQPDLPLAEHQLAAG